MEDNRRKTISQIAEAEFTEKRSRFIGQLAPADTEEDAKKFLDRIRSEQKGARHNVYAWIIGEHDQFMRSSDDGEPAGTGGRPVLESIKQADLHNVVLVVTRYFGGILLGAGGLTRAYAKAAQLAIDSAKKIVRIPAGKYALTIDYGFLTKAVALLEESGCQILDKIFSDKVLLICAAATSDIPMLKEKLTDMSRGSFRLDDLGETAFLERSAK